MESKLKPTPAKAAELQANFKHQCEKAAKEIKEADVLLVVTGAGFSADSGLALYSDVAKIPAYERRGLSYHDICEPKWVDQDPELFYGFFGQCFNDYRSTRPHGGYEIISRWRNIKNQNQSVVEAIRGSIKKKVDQQNPFDSEETRIHTPYDVKDGHGGAFHVFTSNVDAHFYDHFEAAEIHDCHGNIELWQCSSRECEASGIWRAPIEHDFVVDRETMLAPKERRGNDITKNHQPSNINDESCGARIGQTKGTGERTELLRNMPPPNAQCGQWQQARGMNWPNCGHCGCLARPAIFMFGDFGWKYDMSQSIRWDLWRESLLEICNEQNLTVCVIEVGCGLAVQTCRTTSEQMIEDVLQNGGSASLVRINPDYPLAPEYSITEDHVIPIMSSGLRAVEQIDEIYRSFETA